MRKRDDKKNFTYVDFFSGIGGFRVAAEKLGGKSMGYSEIDKQAIETYKSNFKDPASHELGDITKIDKLAYTDIIMGGVPCQSWSVAGKRKGFDDPRGRLWFDSIRMVESSRPKVFIFENVKGLADPRNKENLKLIKDTLSELGYHVYSQLLKAYDFGVPQNRSRIFIVGIRNDLKKSDTFKYPSIHEHTASIVDFLEDVAKKNHKKNKLDSNKIFGDKMPLSRNAFQKNDEFNDFFIFCDTRNGHTTIHSWDIMETADEEKEVCMTIMKNRRKKIYGPLDGNPLSLSNIKALYPKATKKIINTLIKKGILRMTDDNKISLVNTKNSAGINDIYRVYLPNSQIFSTLTATGTKDYVATKYISAKTVEEYKKKFIKEIYNAKKFRQISPREASNIQGFPEDFKLHPIDRYAQKQIGNSVSPPVVEALLKEIKKQGFL